MLARHHHRKLFRHEVRLALAADSSSVYEAESLAIALDDLVHCVARGARNGRDYGAVRAREAIQQS